LFTFSGRFEFVGISRHKPRNCISALALESFVESWQTIGIDSTTGCCSFTEDSFRQQSDFLFFVELLALVRMFCNGVMFSELFNAPWVSELWFYF
jgi:hypothetical protein